MRLGRKWIRFLRSVDTCRIATVDPNGYPHCVPVGFLYHRGRVYIPTVARTRKARNIGLNSKCCIVVDVYERGVGRGLMLQGEAELVRGQAYRRLKRTVERISGWHLDSWDIDPLGPPDSMIVFTPKKVVKIGRV
jgi:nitroimidazol reductase NimA-like FMN-containing flavoprotein (pyridoxamine 5'-phosphate oxidase superfamily)